MIAKTLTTAEEFESICEQFGPCELVRGEVVTLSPGGYQHSQISANVAILLGTWARKTKLGRVLANEAGLIVEKDPDTVRGADVAYVSYQRIPQDTGPEGFSTIPPELIVEVVGRGQGWREMVERAGEYLRMGVDRVWIIDPKTRKLHVFRPDGEPAILAEDQTISDEKILPGFSSAVSEFYAD
jgi:Uma2 family endonuclease